MCDNYGKRLCVEDRSVSRQPEKVGTHVNPSTVFNMDAHENFSYLFQFCIFCGHPATIGPVGCLGLCAASMESIKGKKAKRSSASFDKKPKLTFLHLG